MRGRSSRRAFTLIELLVVMGIIAVLVAIILPTVRAARLAALGTVCESHLHELTAACTMYLNEHKAYPETPSVVMTGDPSPKFITMDFLNELGPYLSYPALSPTATLDQIPEIVQCPFVHNYFDDPSLIGPIPLPGGEMMVTGYMYTARLDEIAPTKGVVLQPKRVPPRKGNHRGVIWADDVSLYMGAGYPFLPPCPPVWAYFHFIKQPTYTAPGLADTTAMRGQHRAWSDGSVEWVPRDFMDFDPAHYDTAASFTSVSGGARIAYYWF